MRCAAKAHNEDQRLKRLAEYGLDSKVDLPKLDPIVEMTAQMFDSPVAAVNIIGDQHVFLAAQRGLPEYDNGRDVSFCAHVILQDDVMVVDDCAHDIRFHDNPMVASGNVHFYAGAPLRSPTGEALGALCIIDSKPRPPFTPEERARLKELAKLVCDRLELRRLDIAAAHPENFAASTLESPNAIICFDADSRITDWNDAAAAMFGHSASDIVGQSLDLIIDEPHRAAVRAAIARVHNGEQPSGNVNELTGVRANGERFPVEHYWARWNEGDGVRFASIVRDMTAKRREQDALYHLANYDAFTDLPNRNLLRRRMREEMAKNVEAGLIIVGVTGVADIANTLGHAAGDNVLQQAAKRIQAAAPDSSFLARTGNDEFGLLLPERNPISLGDAARKINAALAAPIFVDGHEVRLAGNCGFAVSPDHGTTADTLLSAAKLALDQSRSSGRGGILLYIPALRAEAVARRMYDAELHRAFERNEFDLFYQPQVRMHDGAMIGAEALIRWRHPDRGLLAPAAFLPSLENSVLAAPVSEWVLNTACAQAAQWRTLNPEFQIAVNLTSAQFRSGDLAQTVLDALAAHDLPPHALELEITENIILNQQDNVLDQLYALREAGVTLSFDDFGTGFASLNMLRTIPVTHIKIDKSFTQVMMDSPKDQIIILSLIDLARQLDIQVIAEGVEEPDQWALLRARGCDKGQGYLFGKPMPAAIFAERFFPLPLEAASA